MVDTELMDTEDELKFYQDVHEILDEVKSKIYEAANNIMAYAYWNVGKRIIEQEQKGNRKAKYGSYLIKRLSQEPTERYRILRHTSMKIPLGQFIKQWIKEKRT